jgi:uroporphyrinogen-III decarboxylase
MPMTSRQRLLSALEGHTPDHVPCSFMLFNGIKPECHNYIEFIQRQLDMGLDPYVQIPPRPPVVVNDYYDLHGLPVSYPPNVFIQEWKEDGILYKTYRTPAGTLRAEVRPDEGWKWGDHIPFLDDYLVGRSQKFIIDRPEDLPALESLLAAPTNPEISAFQQESTPVLEFARQHDLLVAGGWGVGADMIGWIYGLQRMIFSAHDDERFISDLLNIIAKWNRARMEVVLEAGIDLYIKRAWYENCDFWSPRVYRKFILPILKEDVELAHACNTKFGYIITSNCMHLLDQIVEARVDVIIGADPSQWDLTVAKEKLAGKVCLWGGVNGHLTVELGTPDQVRTEVRRAIETLAAGGGFILSPVDNVREFTPEIKENVKALIDEWQLSVQGYI